MTLNEELIHRNAVVHDNLARIYDISHPEIFNSTEQARLRNGLTQALAHIDGLPARPTILDFGAGTGNISAHLLHLGANVIAADISLGSLAILRERLGDSDRLRVQTQSPT